jgi:hypothetical protein
MSVGEGKETVDVALQRADLQIACEVSVTTTVDHEMGNARKCFKAGFNFVLLITADDGRRAQMTKAMNGHFPPEDRGRIHCLSPDEAIEFIRNLPPPAPHLASPESEAGTAPKVIRGYKVKRKYVPLTPAEKADKCEKAYSLLVQDMLRPPPQE